MTTNIWHLAWFCLFLSSCSCSETDLTGHEDADLDGIGEVDSTIEPIDGTEIPEDGILDPDIAFDPDADIDPAPEPPPEIEWDPSADHIGESGWGESTEPFCRDSGWGLTGWDIWADPRGVFAIVAETNHGPITCPTTDREEAPAFQYIAHNDGTGWRFSFETILCDTFWSCWRGLTGIPNSILVVSSGAGMCEPSSPVTEDGITLSPFEGRHMFVVDETLAYALLESNLLSQYDGDSWGPFAPNPLPLQANLIWASRSAIVVAGPEGVVMSHEETGWRLHDTETLDDVSALWAFDENDVWIGTRTGRLLRFDGEIWSEMDWPRLAGGCDEPDAIEEIWGADGVLFFRTQHDLVEWNGFWFRNILNFDCGSPYQTITSLWVNTPEEVFVSIDDELWPTDSCDPTIILWWDGMEFHRF